MASLLKPLFKTKSKIAKVLFIASIVFAGPVSFLLYDYYINWTASSSSSIVWYLAFLYDTMGAWGGVALSATVAFLLYFAGMKFHARKQIYQWS